MTRIGFTDDQVDQEWLQAIAGTGVRADQMLEVLAHLRKLRGKTLDPPSTTKFLFHFFCRNIPGVTTPEEVSRINHRLLGCEAQAPNGNRTGEVTGSSITPAGPEGGWNIWLLVDIYSEVSRAAAVVGSLGVNIAMEPGLLPEMQCKATVPLVDTHMAADAEERAAQEREKAEAKEAIDADAGCGCPHRENPDGSKGEKIHLTTCEKATTGAK